MKMTAPPSPLAVHRVAAGLTQVELARRTGISRAALANLEQRKHRPHRLTAKALGEALGVDVEILFPALDLNDERRPATGGVVQESERQLRHGTA